MARSAEIAKLQANPFDPEAQRKIEELIKQEQLDQQYETAMEHMPELFARVSMLYIDIQVNKVPIQVIFDNKPSPHESKYVGLC
jgi:DNA damage-inducible protein 1